MRATFLIFCILCFSVIAFADESFDARILRVLDGDTIDVEMLPNGKRMRVRLVEIDAPEKAQPYGLQSTAALRAMIDHDVLRVISDGKDRYGRILGEIFLDDVSINRRMIAEGHAWIYRRYAKRGWEKDEEAARHAHLGLWASNDAVVAPWDWRSMSR